MTDAEFVESITRELERADDGVEELRAYTMTAAMGGEANTVPFIVSHSERSELYDFAEELQDELLDYSIIQEVQLSIEDTVPEILIEVDDEAALDNGLTPAEVATQVNEATQGETVATVQIPDDEEEDANGTTTTYEVVVGLDASFTDSVDELEVLTIRNNEGETVNLNDIAEITEGESPAAVQRADQEEAVEFTVGYTTAAVLSDVSDAIVSSVDEVELPDGANFSFGGEQEILDDAMMSMVLALVLAVTFIYLIMLHNLSHLAAIYYDANGSSRYYRRCNCPYSNANRYRNYDLYRGNHSRRYCCKQRNCHA